MLHQIVETIPTILIALGVFGLCIAVLKFLDRNKKGGD